MASLEYLRDEMNRARQMADDKSLPAHVRHASDARFWHCVKRVGAMERGGFAEDDPGHFLVGFREEESARAAKRSLRTQPAAPLVSEGEHRRRLMDRRSEVQIAARERL